MTRRPKHPRAFTLIELMVAISLLVLVILAVGRIFRDAGKAVGISQVSMEMFSNVRAVQQQIESDVQKIDRRGFLVIRSRWQGTPYTAGSYLVGAHVIDNSTPPRGYQCIADVNGSTPPSVDTQHWSLSRDRADQIAFLANGTFTNRTGAISTSTSALSLTDPLTANSAVVYYGHLIREGQGTAYGAIQGPARQDLAVAVNAADWVSQMPLDKTDQDFVLGRHTMVFFPGYQTSSRPVDFFNGYYSPAYGDIRMISNNTSSNPSDILFQPSVTINATPSESNAHIASSRIDISNWSPEQLMAAVISGVSARGRSSALRYEADTLCYRFKTLPSAYAGEYGGSNLANGVIRMHPIMLEACPSFEVEWTDGSVYSSTGPATFGNDGSGPNANHFNAGYTIPGSTPPDPRTGQIRWFGLNQWAFPRGTDNNPINSAGSNLAQQVTEPPLASGDGYTAIFTFDNRANWPKALKFTYRATDVNNRLPGGREFSQIVRLPE